MVSSQSPDARPATSLARSGARRRLRSWMPETEFVGISTCVTLPWKKSAEKSTCANHEGGICWNIDLCKPFSCTNRFSGRISLGTVRTTTRSRRRLRLRTAPTRWPPRPACACGCEASWEVQAIIRECCHRVNYTLLDYLERHVCKRAGRWLMLLCMHGLQSSNG